MKEEEKKASVSAFAELLDVIDTLHSPEGCPWDKAQTPLSLRSDMLEEVYEAVDAISAGDVAHAKEELGDVILNTLSVIYMYEESEDFSLSSCLTELKDKLVRRHPHVFAKNEESDAKDAGEALALWEDVKVKVEKRSDSPSSVPGGFPALLYAYKVQKKAAKKGFDHDDAAGAKAKVFEELDEVQEALKKVEAFDDEDFALTKGATLRKTQALLHLQEEVGDVFFSLVNYARHLGVQPEVALSFSSRKFCRRFSYVEENMKERGIAMKKENLKEMEEAYERAKKHE